MGIVTEIDRRLRHSRLARAQPLIRAQAPWLHKALLVARDRLLPFRSRFGLSRYQHRDIERFLSFRPDTARVLEVGSDVDGAVLKELAARGLGSLIGINIDVKPSAHAGRGTDGLPDYEIAVADARQLPFGDASVSSIVSITAFEHIHDFDVALREMHRVLRPGGTLYADFGPIWSCSIGHHVFAIVDGVEARHWKPGRNPVPHFAHLLLTREELRESVLRRAWVFPRLADEIVRWIYDSDGINRLFYEDYVRLFERSPFAVEHLEPVREAVPAPVQARLEQACPGYTEFGVRMAEVLLRKR
jgi:SAM-dependent methyltransferase